MSIKNYYFTFFPEIYIRDYKKSIFLFNTRNNSKSQITNTKAKNCVLNGIDTYNNSILFSKENLELFEQLERNGYGIIEITESAKYTPFKSKFKILNDRIAINKKNDLVIRQQLCNNLLEVNLFLFDLFSSTCNIERQYHLQKTKQRKSSHQDWELLKFFLHHINEFKNFQNLNVFVDSESYLNDFLKLEVDLYQTNLWLHLPFDLYNSKNQMIADLSNIVIWIYDLNDLCRLSLLNKNHKIIFKASNEFMVEEIVKYSDLSDNISIDPLFENNISFFEKNVFIEESDLLETSHKLEHLVRNATINYNDFGRLFIDLSGNYTTNQFCNSLGIMNTDNLMEVLLNCINSENSTWFKTRETVTPCNECNYCNICPPISGLEYLINQFNLCHLHHE